MRKSPAIAALCATAMATGLVAATISPAQADAPDTALDHLPALERDLGLTSAEAAELLSQQAEASDLESELSETLGAEGSVFDIDTGELTVYTPDAAQVEDIEAAGANAEVVTYGADDLDGIVEDLNASAEEADSGITGWYPDLENDTVVLTVEYGETAAGEALVAEAGVDAAAVTIEESAETPEIFPDIIGGNAYYPGGSRCSIGFSVNGGFVTAGHCGGVGTSTSNPDGTVAGSIFPGRDMGVVNTTSAWTPTPSVNLYQYGGYATVVGSQEAPTGGGVCRSGSTTGTYCGSIQAKNQTVFYAQGTVQGLTRTNVCAEPGDSGGSWITPSRTAAQAQGVTSGGSGNCSTGGTTYFQPVNPILNQFNRSLITG